MTIYANSTNREDSIEYSEGQWFAVPISQSRYALGVIARGSHKTRGGLGYFFKPEDKDFPDGVDTIGKMPSDALLIAWFGDLAIIQGRWPLINSAREFNRSEWPIPLFKQEDPIRSDKAWLVQYDQADAGHRKQISRSLKDSDEVEGYPTDGLFGARAIEITISALLDDSAN